jgi:hypothetical protein
MYYALLRLYKYCPCVCFEYIEQLPYLEASKLKALLDSIEFKSKQRTTAGETQPSTPDEVSFGIVTKGSGVGGNDMLSIGGSKLHFESVPIVAPSNHKKSQTFPTKSEHKPLYNMPTGRDMLPIAPQKGTLPSEPALNNDFDVLAGLPTTNDGHNGFGTMPSVSSKYIKVNVPGGMIAPPQEHVFVIMYLFEVAGILFSNHSSTPATQKDYINIIKIRVQKLPHATVSQLIKVLDESGVSEAVLDNTACMNIAYMLLQFIKQL